MDKKNPIMEGEDTRFIAVMIWRGNLVLQRWAAAGMIPQG